MILWVHLGHLFGDDFCSSDEEAIELFLTGIGRGAVLDEQQQFSSGLLVTNPCFEASLDNTDNNSMSEDDTVFYEGTYFGVHLAVLKPSRPNASLYILMAMLLWWQCFTGFFEVLEGLGATLGPPLTASPFNRQQVFRELAAQVAMGFQQFGRLLSSYIWCVYPHRWLSWVCQLLSEAKSRLGVDCSLPFTLTRLLIDLPSWFIYQSRGLCHMLVSKISRVYCNPGLLHIYLPY